MPFGTFSQSLQFGTFSPNISGCCRRAFTINESAMVVLSITYEEDGEWNLTEIVLDIQESYDLCLIGRFFNEFNGKV